MNGGFSSQVFKTIGANILYLTSCKWIFVSEYYCQYTFRKEVGILAVKWQGRKICPFEIDTFGL